MIIITITISQLVKPHIYIYIYMRFMHVYIPFYLDMQYLHNPNSRQCFPQKLHETR